MDPMTIAALMGGASGVIKGASGAPAGPSMAYGGYADGQAYNSSPLSSSNWTVATSGSKASATNTGDGIHWQWIAVAAVVGLVVVKKVLK